MPLFKEVSYQLSKLIEDIELGEIGLPELQRPFVWKNTKVRDLFDSMYRGFPVGYFLFWASSDGYKPIGGNRKQKVPRLLIVDGQQRLTSLFAVMKSHPVLREDFRSELIPIAFRPLDGKFSVADAAVRNDPAYIPDISAIWSPETDLFELTDKYLAGLRANQEVQPITEKQVKQAIQALANLSNFPFTALELSPTVSEDAVAEVFVRINSKGTPLNQANFILTLMSVHWDDGRFELERFCRDARHPAANGPSPHNHFIDPDPDQLLRVSVARGFGRARLEYVYNLLRGKDLETGEFSDENRDNQFAVLRSAQEDVLNLQNWHEFLKAVHTAGFRRSSMITSKVGLVFSYAMFLLGRHDYRVEPFRLRCVIARWFFMSALTGRYSNSPESTMEQDLGRLRNCRTADDYVEALDQTIGQSLTSDYWKITLPGELATSSANSPQLHAYNAALVLLDAKALFSNMKVADLLDPATQSIKSAVERHHLFPRNHLKAQQIGATRDQNQIANYALVEWSDNIKIADLAPADYWPRYAARFTEDELGRMCHWHALPEQWFDLSYEEFLAARRVLIADRIRESYEQLRALG